MRHDAESRRVLFFAHSCYLDDSNGATIASRAMLEALARHGFAVEALTGTVLESADEVEIESWLIGRGAAAGSVFGATVSVDAGSVRGEIPQSVRSEIAGVPVTFHRSPSSRPHEPGPTERGEMLRLLDRTLDRFRPDVLINFGGDTLAREARSLASARGASVVFALHNFNYLNTDPFATSDAVIVPSQFAADHYRNRLGLDCTILPNLVDVGRAKAPNREPRYLTFVNPSTQKGVFPFVRIADELGRRRPDIPILVVESRATEHSLVGCGIDLRPHGNVFLMAQTPDPRDFWRVTKVALMPSLWWENQPLVAVEAMVNGIPVVGSNRGGIPETLGGSGIVLPLPDRLTPTTRDLPTAEEVAPWIDAVSRLWDDADWYAEQSQLSRVESRRWSAEELEPRYVEFFRNVQPRGNRPAAPIKPVMRSRRDFGAYLNARGLLGTGAEIGVQNGYFSRQILDKWRGETLYMVDIWQPIEGYRDPANVPAAEQSERMICAIRQVAPHWPRVRVVQELSANAARMIPDESLDWVYIDANHDYESVTKDLKLWTPKVKKGGLIAGHDFLDGVLIIDGVETVFDVRRAVTAYFEGGRIDSTVEDFPTWFVTKVS